MENKHEKWRSFWKFDCHSVHVAFYTCNVAAHCTAPLLIYSPLATAHSSAPCFDLNFSLKCKNQIINKSIHSPTHIICVIHAPLEMRVFLNACWINEKGSEKELWKHWAKVMNELSNEWKWKWRLTTKNMFKIESKMSVMRYGHSINERPQTDND